MKYIEFGKYEKQFQIGIYFGIHKHVNLYSRENGKETHHFHLWIDLCFWYIQINIGR